MVSTEHDVEFFEKSIEDLAGSLPVNVLSDKEVARVQGHLRSLNDEFLLFPADQQESIVGLTSRYVKYTTPADIEPRWTDIMSAYLFYWFWLNVQEDSGLIRDAAQEFLGLMSEGKGTAAAGKIRISPYLGWLSRQWSERGGAGYRFCASFESMVCAMAWDLDRGSLDGYDVEFYDQIRTCSIGTQPWFDGWRSMRDDGDLMVVRAEVCRLEYLCRRIQYLANDLCSVVRDLGRGGSSLVLLYHRREKLPLSDSIDHVETRHDAAIEELMDSYDEAIRRSTSEVERWYVHFLVTCTAGNVLGMKELEGYYRRVVFAG